MWNLLLNFSWSYLKYYFFIFSHALISRDKIFIIWAPGPLGLGVRLGIILVGEGHTVAWFIFYGSINRSFVILFSQYVCLFCLHFIVHSWISREWSRVKGFIPRYFRKVLLWLSKSVFSFSSWCGAKCWWNGCHWCAEY